MDAINRNIKGNLDTLDGKTTDISYAASLTTIANALTVSGNTSLIGSTTFERTNDTSEGGQINLKMSDNGNYWYIDCYARFEVIYKFFE